MSKDSMKIELGEIDKSLSTDERGIKHIVFNLMSRPDKQVVTYAEQVYSQYINLNRQNPLITQFSVSRETKKMFFKVSANKVNEGFDVVKQFIEQANKKRADFDDELSALNPTK